MHYAAELTQELLLDSGVVIEDPVNIIAGDAEDAAITKYWRHWHHSWDLSTSSGGLLVSTNNTEDEIVLGLVHRASIRSYKERIANVENIAYLTKWDLEENPEKEEWIASEYSLGDAEQEITWELWSRLRLKTLFGGGFSLSTRNNWKLRRCKS